MSIFKKLFGKDKPSEITPTPAPQLVAKPAYNPESDYNNAFDAYANGNLPLSLKLIENIFSIVDKPQMKHYAFRANIFEDMNNHTKAISDYESAISLAPNPHNAYQFYHQIGFNYLSLKSNEQAEKFYTKAIDLKSVHPNSASDPDKEVFDEGIMKGLTFARMYNNRGNARKNQGKLDEAFEDCRKAIELEPNYSNPYLLTGQLFELKGNYSEAIKWVEKSIALGNQSANRILYNLKDNLSRNPPVEIQQLFDSCMRACDSGNYYEAINGGKKLLEVFNNPAGHYVLGLAYILMDDNLNAKKHCLESYKHVPMETNNINRLGVACCSLGDIQEGLFYFRKGMELGDNNCRQNYTYWSIQ